MGLAGVPEALGGVMSILVLAGVDQALELFTASVVRTFQVQAPSAMDTGAVKELVLVHHSYVEEPTTRKVYPETPDPVPSSPAVQEKVGVGSLCQV